MKICWDNLEKLIYNSNRGEWKNKHGVYYIYKNSCKNCQEPYLTQKDNYTCQKCNKHQDELDVGLHCHHLEGIRYEPLESADLDKVITLCKGCHKEVHKQPDCGYNDMRCK